ncbi:alpha/beta fold hydrolase [Candidatus Uhrbacteria bacterium]|nr:alpha/beta fold hydrolase [Candidatus Uhrbacteria bacterium]
MKLFVIFLTLIFVIGAGCAQNKTMSERIILKTSDEINIIGTYRNTNQEKIALLFHMMPATKESWESFAEKLSKYGYASLAIDERGHGESTMNGELNYKNFSDAQQQAKRLDVEAAIAFAKEKGFEENRIVLIGASIGANLAIQALVEHKNISTAVVLSPGLDYHGVLTAPAIQNLGGNQKVILVASDDDSESFESVQVLHKKNPEQTILIERSGIGHGTQMTDHDNGLIEEILKYIP